MGNRSSTMPGLGRRAFLQLSVHRYGRPAVACASASRQAEVHA
jgi:hypothetical protein